jgi:hypothetical protein
MVELGRDLLVKGKGFGGQKRALKELNINIAGLSQSSISSQCSLVMSAGDTVQLTFCFRAKMI